MTVDEANRGDGRPSQIDHLKGVPTAKSGYGSSWATPNTTSYQGQQQTQGAKTHEKSVGTIYVIFKEIPFNASQARLKAETRKIPPKNLPKKDFEKRRSSPF